MLQNNQSHIKPPCMDWRGFCGEGAGSLRRAVREGPFGINAAASAQRELLSGLASFTGAAASVRTGGGN